MVFASLTAVAFRRFMLKKTKPLAVLYSTAAKDTPQQGTAIGKELGDMFAVKRIKKNWELIPLFVIIGGAVTGLFGFIAYASQTRDDVRFFSKTNIETTDLLNPKKRKLLIRRQEYRPMQELHDLYEDMRKGEEELEENAKEMSADQLVVYDQEYRPMNEIAEAYKDMDEAKSE